MKLPNWFKILWWIILLAIVSLFLCYRFPDLTKGNATATDIFIFLIWVTLFLLPLFEELSFFGISFKKEVEKLKSDITTQIDTLKADIKKQCRYHPAPYPDNRIYSQTKKSQELHRESNSDRALIYLFFYQFCSAN